MFCLNTNVDTKYFGSKLLPIKTLLNTGDQYFYLVKHNETPYTVKGYKIQLNIIKPKDNLSKESFNYSLRIINEVYSEYTLNKVLSMISPHFVQPLEIDSQIDNNSDEVYLYIEVLFEYPGEPLCNMKDIKIELVYDLMRQSANALVLLHSLKIFDFNVTTMNMLYNKDKSLLKLMNLDTIPNKDQGFIVSKSSKAIIKRYSNCFVAPEVFQAKGYLDLRTNTLPKIDIYAWSLCFIKLLQNVVENTEADITGFNEFPQNQYEKFMNMARALYNNILKHNKKYSFLANELFKGAQYEASKRPTIKEVIATLKSFEETNKINTSCIQIESTHEEKLRELLSMNEIIREIVVIGSGIINYNNKEEEEVKGPSRKLSKINRKRKLKKIEESRKLNHFEDSDIVSQSSEHQKFHMDEVNSLCKDCIEVKNIKGLFTCKHTVCESCLSKYAAKAFRVGNQYAYQSFCSKCKKDMELGIVLYYGRKYSIKL